MELQNLPANYIVEHAIYRLVENKYSLTDNRANSSLRIESKILKILQQLICCGVIMVKKIISILETGRNFQDSRADFPGLY